MMSGIVASPTPTIPIASDSTTTISQNSRRIANANAAAAIHPDDPPPTITILRICLSDTNYLQLRITPPPIPRNDNALR